MTPNELREMKLHERHMINDEIYVMRVPGGWLYITETGLTFVPYTDHHTT